MIKVIEKFRQETGQSFDSLIVEIPKDFAVSHGLPEKSFATLTVRNGKIVSEIISYSDEDEKEVEEFLAEFPEFDEEMKKVGD
ncbi:MAG: hypothetical protein M3388_13580 [Acidobacteriota bacterium]|nr:hypothetical protein [Acidobacteriota bacterium]